VIEWWWQPIRGIGRGGFAGPFVSFAAPLGDLPDSDRPHPRTSEYLPKQPPGHHKTPPFCRPASSRKPNTVRERPSTSPRCSTSPSGYNRRNSESSIRTGSSFHRQTDFSRDGSKSDGCRSDLMREWGVRPAVKRRPRIRGFSAIIRARPRTQGDMLLLYQTGRRTKRNGTRAGALSSCSPLAARC